ncbi:MAG: ADP,ATP carrier protein 1 [Chlamydiae bacterium]|nr:ADP,ATP carrier protein 1 [Chlamydiota bacterium]
MSNTTTSEFSGWRAYLWPIHHHELRKLLPMLLVLFLITFDYNILRTMKDTLVVATGKASGAEVIPFIKLWVMFPGSIALTFLFTWLSNRFSRERVFYVMMTLFLSYFVFFVLVLYPWRHILHPHEFADSLQGVLPLGMRGFISMIRNWSFTTFYVMSELWGNIVLFLLFWGFANQITQIGEAKRFYAILGIATNISGIIAGGIAVQISKTGLLSYIPYGSQPWDKQILILVSLVVVCGALAMIIFRWMHSHVLDEETGETVADSKGEVKGRMSMRENFKYLFNSRYLICIAIIAITYNVVINLVEVLWKYQVHTLYPDPSDYNLYMNRVMMVIGLFATVTSFGITGNLIRRAGWTFTAMLTPIILLLTSIAFFGSFFYKEYLGDFSHLTFGIAPLTLVVFFGTLQNCLSRGAKYTIYDATKEMAFVPLSQECKIKGKAAIDGVCIRMGKSGGSAIHQVLLLTFASLSLSAPYVAGFLLVVVAVWMGSVSSLGKQFNALTSSEDEPEPLDEAAPQPEVEPVLQG